MTAFAPEGVSIAVLVPCYNEAVTIAKVVDDFKRVLPTADIYVYDNNSTDGTGDIAREHGAIVRLETRQGKGNVVRQMIRDIDADAYLMVDGDDTYPAEAAPDLLRPLLDGTADVTVGDRLSNGTYGEENDRAFHGFGNNLVRSLIKHIYHFEFSDVMTGYRGFNQVFAKTFPVESPGFRSRTELSIHAVDKRWRIKEVPIVYRDRPEGSESKLNTFSDGMKVLLIDRIAVQGLPSAGALQLGRLHPHHRRFDNRHSRHCGLRANWSGSCAFPAPCWPLRSWEPACFPSYAA